MTFLPGQSGTALGDVNLSRRRINQSFLRRLIEHFERDGEKVIERVAQESPGTYLKVLALLMPRESRVEISNPTGKLSDEQLGMMIAELEERITAHLSGENAKVINAEPTERPRKSSPKALAYARAYKVKYQARKKAEKAKAESGAAEDVSAS